MGGRGDGDMMADGLGKDTILIILFSCVPSFDPVLVGSCMYVCLCACACVPTACFYLGYKKKLITHSDPLRSPGVGSQASGGGDQWSPRPRRCVVVGSRGGKDV